MLFGRDAEPAGLAFWTNEVARGALTPAGAALGIMNGALNADGTAITLKLAASAAYSAAIDTTAKILAYSGDTAAGIARSFLGTVITTAPSAAAIAANIVALVDNANAGTTFTLTANTDVLKGTALNDLFIADSSTLNAADSIDGGAGTDTLKIVNPTTTVATLLTNLALTSVEKLFLVNPANTSTFNVAGIAGLTSVQVDAQGAVTTNVAVGTGQSIIASNNTATDVLNITGNTPTDIGLTLINTGSGTTTEQIDFTGTALTTLNVTGLTTKSSATLFNSGNKITTLNISSGVDLKLIAVSNLSANLTKIDASASTAAVSVDTTAGAKTAGFTFKGGSGNDTLLLRAGDLTNLTSGAQLDGGAGTGDKLVTQETTFSATDYTKLNATIGFEVLGTGATNASVDGSQLTSIKSFSIDGNGTQTYTAMQAGSSVVVTAPTHANALSFSAGVGVSDLALTLGTATSTGVSIGGNLTIGQFAVAIDSQGTNANPNVITNLLNKDNSTFTITGSNDLTISAMRATTTGSTVNGAAATGVLKITGNQTAFSAGSTLGDTLIGGAGADTLRASKNGGVLTGNGGNDTFDVSQAFGGTSANFQTLLITDFTKGDKILWDTTATAFTSTKVDLSSATTIAQALDKLAAGNNTDLKWGTFGGFTYIVDDFGAGATFAANDTMVKLTGTLDLSTSTFSGNTLTFA